MKVVLCDAETRSSLAALRSLRDAGVTVVLASHKPRAMGFYSRYCCEKFVYPNPTTDASGFLRALSAYQEQSEEPVLFMSFTDVSTDTLQMGKHDGTFPHLFVGPTWEAYSRATNKRELGILAASLGIPTPKVVMHRAVRDEEVALPMLPVIIKPTRTMSWSGTHAYKSTARIARTEEAFKKIYDELQSNTAHPPLVQELIVGDEYGLAVCAHKGQIISLFAYKRLRSVTPHGGVSALRESVPITEEMERIAEKLTHALHWHGVMMIELKKNDTTGQLTLIEINARFWGSLLLAIRSGVNFPYLVYQLAQEAGNPHERVLYRSGVRARHMISDISHFYALGRRSFRLDNLRAFFTFFQKDLYYDVWSLSDPLPGVLELYQFVKNKL